MNLPGGLYLIPGAAVFYVVLGGVTVLGSLVRGTRISAGLTALAWATVIGIVVSYLTVEVPPSSAVATRTLLGAIPAFFLARRDGYHGGAGWLWLLLPGLGWWILLWSRNNQIDRRRYGDPAAASQPTSGLVGKLGRANLAQIDLLYQPRLGSGRSGRVYATDSLKVTEDRGEFIHVVSTGSWNRSEGWLSREVFEES